MEKLRTESILDGQGLRIILDDPKGNVLDGIMMGSLNALLDELRGERGRPLKLLCVTGAGDHFSFGASVPEHVGERAAAMLRGFHGIFERLIELGIPTAAAVKGRCLGGGLELATFCNRVVAHEGAKLGQPEIQLAVLAPIASLILPHRIGQARADDVLLTGRTIGAAEAKELGLIDAIAEDPAAEIEEWARRELLPKSASSLRFAVRAARWRMNESVRSGIADLERFYLEGLMATHDANEGLTAFLEKRPARYTDS